MNNQRRLIVAGLLGLALQLPAVFAHSAIDPAPRGDRGWQDRQKLLNERAAEAGDKAQVIFIGDSITQGWEGAGKEVWEKYYAPRHAVNLGIGGDRTQHVLWRLDHGNLDGLKPKAAVVMIGTNNSNGEDNTVEQIAEGVTAIVKKLRDKLPETKVILIAIFPRGENPQPQRGKLLEVNQILQRLGDNRDVFYVDFGYKFVDEHGLISTSAMPDYLHLTPPAYAIWASSIEGLLSHLLGDTPVVATTTGASLTGEWTWTMKGPDGNPVEAAMILQQDGERVTGKIARGPDRWLEIQDGKVSGSEFSWTVNRDRPDGGNMSYRMSGKLVDGQIAGVARTEMNGNEVASEWSAKRK